MKSFLIIVGLCAAMHISAQTRSYIKVPATFSITTKQWVLQQYKNAAQGQPVLYRANVFTCGNNYGCQSVVLPVTGMELAGVRINKEKVKLNWKTYTEINNSGFDVERTFDINGIFSATGFVAGSVNISSEKNYEFVDDNKYEGITYYRLKQIDLNGSFRYSNIVAVKGYTNEIGIKPYPNPARANNLNFEVMGLKVGSSISIVIYDNAAKKMYEDQHIRLNSTYSFNCKRFLQLASGVYHINMFSESKQASATFIINE
jgi:hypothetical protein